MAVLTSKSGGSGPRSPEGKERFENGELYRKRVDVEKFNHTIKPVKSIIYAVEKRWLLWPTFGTPSSPRFQRRRNPQAAVSGSVENVHF
jgi:hypothetical protein